MKIDQMLTPEQKRDALGKLVGLTLRALRETPGGVATLGRIALADKDGQQILALALLLESRGEL